MIAMKLTTKGAKDMQLDMIRTGLFALPFQFININAATFSQYYLYSHYSFQFQVDGRKML